MKFKYSLAKQPPHQNLTVEELTKNFGTLDFLPAFSSFLRRHLPGTTITPSHRDRFDGYKQIVIPLPSNRYLGDNILTDRVRTSPAVDARGHALAKAAHFDTAFMVEDLPLYKSEGGLSGVFFSFINLFISDFFSFFVGLRVAQIRLIFNLPPQFGTLPHPLAYVEWFTRFGSPDINTGLYSVTRSTHQGQRNSEIVSVDRIVRGCHLMARCGQNIHSGWTTDSILEQNSVQFLVNPYINVHSFTLLKPSLFSK